MYNWILGLHSLLRWVIVIVLIINIARTVLNNEKPFSQFDKNWNLRLLIFAHLNFLIGLYNYFFGGKGFAYINELGFGAVMKDKVMRFWAVEHFVGMLVFVVLVTLSRRVTKNTTLDDVAKHKKLMWFYIISFVVLFASIPWPFRFAEVPWFRPLS
ncbi:MAG: hypothetical protein ACOVMI_06370 [Chitinophagaceae bacterium]|jgi:hypothetical protein